MTGVVCAIVGTFSTAAAAEIIRYKKGIVANGNAQIDTAQSKFGGSSALFDGTGDYLLVENIAGDITGDFTFECFVRFSAFPSSGSFHMLATGDSNRYFALKNDGGTQKWESSLMTGANQYVARYTPTISTGVWYHIALIKSGGTLTLYQDGVALTATTVAGSMTSSSTLFVSGTNILGAFTSANYSLNGWLDEIRISNSARYTTGFTPSTTAFVNDSNTLLLLHMDGTDASTFFEDDNGVRAQRGIVAQNGCQIDNAQSKFGGTSALFNATNDIQLRAHEVDILSGNFTIEFWFRPNNGAYILFHNRPSLSFGANEMFCYYVSSSNRLEWNINGYGSLSYSNTSMPHSNWYHVAWVRSGTTVTLYVNGTAQTDTKTNYTADIGNANRKIWYFGSIDGGGDEYSGWIDEVRISNTARYTSNFTAPSAPFVNDSNTLLLMHMDGTDASTVFRDDNGAVPVAITTTDAVSFDGTGDYYEATSLSSSVTADSKYALICINLYWAGGTNLQHPVNLRLGTGSGDYGFWIWINGGRSQLKFVTGTGTAPGSIYENTENSLTQNAWNQIVMWIDTTSSTTSEIWVNGNQKAYSNDGFPTGALFNWTNTATTLKIGQKNTSQTGQGADFNGRISQVYISASSTFPGIDKFWQQGKPHNLGTTGTSTGLATPLFYHYGGTSTFTTNQGNFASYTLTANGGVTTSANNSIYQTLRTQKGIVASGNAQIDTAQSKFGGASALFDGTGDYLNTNHSFNWHNQTAGTIEFFFRLNSTVPFAQGFFSQCTEGASTGLQLLSVSNRLYLYKSAVSGNAYEAYNVNLTTGQWYHIAIVKESTSTVKFYVDGTLRHTDSSASGYTDNSANFWIGRGFGLSSNLWDSTRYDLNGWVDEVRISNTARYTANFTAPTTPFSNDANTVLLLHMDGTDGQQTFFDDNGQVPQTP